MIHIALQFLAALSMWCAFKPLGLWQMVFVAALCWLPAIATERRLPKHSYKLIYLASALAWLALLQGIRLAYWPLYAGWIALSLYVAVYIPIFILVSRLLVHRWKLPLLVAAPTVWIGCELIRCYFLTGFGACLLSHTLAERPALIQLAAHIGPQGLSGLIILTGAALFHGLMVLPEVQRTMKQSVETENAFGQDSTGTLTIEAAADTDEDVDIDSKREPEASQFVLDERAIKKNWIAFAGSLVAVIILFGYSTWIYFDGQRLEDGKQPLFKAALIQEVAETRFEYDPDRAYKSWERYALLTSQTGKAHPDLDLVVWPESVFTSDIPYVDWDKTKLPQQYLNALADPQGAYANLEFAIGVQARSIENIQRLAAGESRELYIIGNRKTPEESSLKAPAMLLGINLWRIRPTGFERFNAVVLQPQDGKGAPQFYSKQKLVMFGEYIPFAAKYPDFYESLGMAILNFGDRWESFEIKDARIGSSICFEDVLPQVMQDQVASLVSRNESPDVLINVTNDGWFRGSSMLDHHFACAVFAAVENRRPMLVAANTGISTWVSGNGVVKVKSPKMKPDAVIAKPIADARWGLWQQIGDWPERLCGLLVVLALIDCAAYKLRTKFQRNSNVNPAD